MTTSTNSDAFPMSPMFGLIQSTKHILSTLLSCEIEEKGAIKFRGLIFVTSDGGKKEISLMELDFFFPLARKLLNSKGTLSQIFLVSMLTLLLSGLCIHISNPSLLSMAFWSQWVIINWCDDPQLSFISIPSRNIADISPAFHYYLSVDLFERGSADTKLKTSDLAKPSV